MQFLFFEPQPNTTPQSECRTRSELPFPVHPPSLPSLASKTLIPFPPSPPILLLWMNCKNILHRLPPTHPTTNPLSLQFPLPISSPISLFAREGIARITKEEMNGRISICNLKMKQKGSKERHFNIYKSLLLIDWKFENWMNEAFLV